MKTVYINFGNGDKKVIIGITNSDNNNLLYHHVSIEYLVEHSKTFRLFMARTAAWAIANNKKLDDILFDKDINPFLSATTETNIAKESINSCIVLL